MDDDFFGDLKTETKPDITPIDDLTELNNVDISSTVIIADNATGNFLLAVLISKEVIPGVNDKAKKTKTPNVAKFTFTNGDRQIVLNKFFRGSLEEWGDEGGEIFSLYRLFKVNQEKKDDIDYLTRVLSSIIKTPSKLKNDIVFKNLPITKTKYKNKYESYKINYEYNQ